MSYTLFAERWGESYFIRLDSDFDTRANYISVKSIIVVEDISYTTPVMKLRAVDGIGDLLMHSVISPDAEYTLSIGREPLDSVSFKFSSPEITGQPMSDGRFENVMIELTFLNNRWNKLVKESYSRSWPNKKYSDVMQELLDEAGFEDTFVEETKKNYNIIQPDWTNDHLIYWMSNNAVNMNDIPGYTFFININDKATFATYDYLIKQEPKTFYKLGISDYNADHIMSNFAIEQHYNSTALSYGYGLNASYFDYNTKSFITEEKKFSDTSQSQLSDWTCISQEHETATRKMHYGRDTQTPYVAESKIAKNINNMNTITFSVKGNHELHVGDIVDLYIFPGEYTTTLYNDRYSGYWLVTRVKHEFIMSNRLFSTHVTAVRAGVNGVDLSGYVASSTGKNITPVEW